MEAVLELRFDAGQGYLLSRPASELASGTVDLFELMSVTSLEGEPVSGAA